MKAFTDDKLKVAQMKKYVREMTKHVLTENIVGKGENVCYQHFLLSILPYHKPSFSGSELYGKGLTTSIFDVLFWKEKINEKQKKSL